MLIAILGFAMQSSTPPPETSQFGFWVGHWQANGKMYSSGQSKPTNTTAENTIRMTMNGFVVEENFRMAGLNGKSWSVYNPSTKKWSQTWVDDTGGYIALEGGWANGKMILTTLKKSPTSKSFNRMVFHDIKKDSFTWDWEGTTDGGKTWNLSWRISYVRKKP